MAIEVFSSAFCVDFQSMQETSFAIKENDFTAGYTQRDADGINNIRDTWSVSFSDMPYVEMVDVWAFLQRHKGYKAFEWTPPRESNPRRWVCTRLRRSMNSANSWTINATFQERFVYIPGQIRNTHLLGVQASALRGNITAIGEIEEGNQPLNGVEANGIVGPLFPNAFLTEFFSVVYSPSSLYTAAHIASDGYLYVRARSRYIFKIDRDAFEVVGIFDCVLDGGSTTSSLDSFYSDEHMICSDDTYLYFSFTGKMFRLLLSDFSTFSTFTVAYQTTQYIFVYGGYLWMLPTTTTTITRLLLSDFSTTSTLSLASLVTTGNTLKTVKGFVVHDHYCTCVMNTDKVSMRLDLDDFTTSGVSLLDVSAGGTRQRYLLGKGAYDDDYVYFSNIGFGEIYRISRDHTTFDVYSFGKAANPDYGFGAYGVVLVGDYLYLTSNDSGAPYLIKIDLASNGGAFSDLTQTFANITEMVLGGNPAGDRSPTGYAEPLCDDQWVYCFPEKGTSYGNYPIMRVPLDIGSYDPFPLPSLTRIPPSQYDWDWVGDDLAPNFIQTVSLDYSIYGGPNKVNKRRYIIAMAVRFATGGEVTSISIGGLEFTLLKGKSSGAMYVGIWMLDPPNSTTDITFLMQGTDYICYYTGQIYTIEGTENFDVIFTDEQSSNGTSATFDYNADAGGFAYGVVMVDASPTDWNIVLSDGEWDYDNYDTWGPETEYADATMFATQFSAQDPIAADIAGGTLTVDWNSPPDTESYDWIGVLVSISFKDPNPDPNMFISGVQGICIGYPQ